MVDTVEFFQADRARDARRAGTLSLSILDLCNLLNDDKTSHVESTSIFIHLEGKVSPDNYLCSCNST